MIKRERPLTGRLAKPVVIGNDACDRWAMDEIKLAGSRIARGVVSIHEMLAGPMPERSATALAWKLRALGFKRSDQDRHHR